MAEFVRFQSTLWSRIRLVQQHDSRAVADFVERYRPPVLRYVRNAGIPEADAEDLVQEVFTRLLAADVIRKAEEEKGKFRSFLLAVTRNVIREARRRAKGSPQPLEGTEVPAPEPSEEEFDRSWMLHLLSSALETLERDQPHYHRALTAHILEGKEYRQIADEMGRSLQDIKNYVHRSRAKLTDLLQREVVRYASSAEEYEEEIRYLSRFLE